MGFYRELRSPIARVAFALHQLSGRLSAPESLKRLLRFGVGGTYSSDDMTLKLRRGTWDAWTAHPGHERETHAWIRQTFDGGVMFDVGAYCGSFSLRYRRKFDQVHCFEASSENYTALEKNILASGHRNNAKAVRAAIAASPGTLKLYLTTPDTNSLIGTGAYEEVTAITLGHFEK